MKHEMLIWSKDNGNRLLLLFFPAAGLYMAFRNGDVISAFSGILTVGTAVTLLLTVHNLGRDYTENVLKLRSLYLSRRRLQLTKLRLSELFPFGTAFASFLLLLKKCTPGAAAFASFCMLLSLESCCGLAGAVTLLTENVLSGIFVLAAVLIAEKLSVSFLPGNMAETLVLERIFLQTAEKKRLLGLLGSAAAMKMLLYAVCLLRYPGEKSG